MVTDSDAQRLRQTLINEYRRKLRDEKRPILIAAYTGKIAMLERLLTAEEMQEANRETL